MKRLLVANVQKQGKRYTQDKIEILMKAQIENMIEIGWQTSDIILLSNFNFEFMNVKATLIPLNDFCFTGSKMFAIKWLFDTEKINDVVWASDLDCWQNIWFNCPEFNTDVACATYSNPKFNGGNVFWKPGSIDIINEIVKRLSENQEAKEEPILNKVFKSKEFWNRITILNHTYNVGCSGFIPRYSRSDKPIHVCHFHPYNRIAWEMHALDREGLGEIAVTVRLERLLRRYYPDLATKLSERKKKTQKPKSNIK